MHRRALALILSLGVLSFLPGPARAQSLDQYGGYTGLPVPGGGTGHFRVAKLGSRWVFATPLGNAFWLRGVYHIDLDSSTDERGGDYTKRIIAKYGNTSVWATQEILRLQSWGFNAFGEYTHVQFWNRFPGIFLFNATNNALTLRFGVTGVPQAPKELWSTLNHSIYTGWAAPMVDFWDPNYEAYVIGYVSQNIAGLQPVYDSPWTIGFATDDRDYLFGFGPGVEVPAYSPHPHLGWICLVANFQQSSNSSLGQTYGDPKVYAKYAIRDQLQAKYGTIAALNAAWGASYTSWDTAGGWGTGTGFLDEDGHHAWVPSDYNGLSGATAAMVGDLNDFLLAHARKYYTIQASAIRAAAPSVLLFGVSALNSDGLTRREILQAAGESMDVLHASIGSQTVLNLTAQYFGDKPIVTYELMEANPDSAFWRYPLPAPVNPTWEFTTQPARGTAYQTMLATHLNHTALNGVQPIAGLKWWEFHDNWGEKGNYGLVSLSDNAYDGVEAAVTAGTDPWGYPTGGEERNYGDFLSFVASAHAQIPSLLGAVSPLPSSALTAAVISPTDGSTVSGTVPVTGAGSDSGSTVTRVDLLMDQTLVAANSAHTVTYTWDTTKTKNGNHSWVARAYDSLGNFTSSSPVTVTVNNPVLPDTSPLTVAINQPAAGGVVARKSSVVILATVFGNVGTSTVRVYVNGKQLCADSTAPYSCSWKVPAVPGKTYQLQAKTIDSTGAVAASTVVIVTAQ
jgi:Bacterial Ig domain